MLLTIKKKTMIQGTELFNLISRDSMSWLDNSEKLKFSSEIIYNELQKLIEPFQKGIQNYEDEDKIIALWASYYLLIGHALENLIKGLSIENNRAANNIEEIYKKWNYKSGHGISKIANDNISNLTNDEVKILEKLEIYILWAGRFILPKYADTFIKEENSLYYETSDYNTINVLFDKIKDMILIEWEKNNSK